MINRYIIVAGLMCLGSSLMAQENSIEGTWQMDVDRSVAMMTGATRSRYDSLAADKQLKVKSAMNGRIFKFLSEGKITVIWKSGTQQRESLGEWKYGPNPGTLQITIDNKIQPFDYHFVDGVLQLTSSEGAGFFSTLCFTRQ